MNILIIADDAPYREMQDKLQTTSDNKDKELTLSFTQLREFQQEMVLSQLPKHDLVIDLQFDCHPETIALYNQPLMKGKPIWVNAVYHTLTAAIAQYSTTPLYCHLVGINGLSSLINRPLWEVSLPDSAPPDEQAVAEKLFNQLGIAVRWIDDRVGMVTPRVIATIVNEAYFLLQERGATAAHIDTALRLGVNYPNGPFEWAEKIGLSQIAKVLETVYRDTQDERYKTCPLLKRASIRC